VSTVLVTGGAGFVGSHLCDRLLGEGRRVVAVDDLSTGHVANLVTARGYGQRFAFANLDVRASGVTALLQRYRPDVVVHLADRREARGAPDPLPEARVGVMGLLNVLDAAVRCGAGKLVLGSGASVYGEQRRLPVRETALAGARPLTAGAISKRVAEDYLRFYRRHRGIDYAILIMGVIYGPRQYPADEAGVVASFAGRMLRGEQPLILGDGEQTRDFLFIDDAVHALSLAVDHGSGRAVNVGTGLETSVNGVFRLLAEITGYRGRPVYGPLPAGEVRRSALDNEVAARELGWRPWTHLEDGLRETVSFLRT
jgi:UDP-glucose 4-epimerase